MRNCDQAPGQSILDHGLAVWTQYQKLLNGDTSAMRLPQWYLQYKDQIHPLLHPHSILLNYAIYHDCGKPFCLEIGDDGKKRFPNHAATSKVTYGEHFGTSGDAALIAELIGLDMIFHTESYEEIVARNLSPNTLCTLMLAALSELHANAEMFGGIESTSFKIKWKRLDKLGAKICKRLFEHAYLYTITRNDLSPPQKAVQSTHAAMEAARAYLKPDDEHPSVIMCIVKGETKLMMTAEKLRAAGIRFREFREPDIGNQLTAIATEPLTGNRREPLKHYQLLT
jgi:hypothetical protein